MKVTIDGMICRVEKEKGDPKFVDGEWGSGESRLLYKVKNILNSQGWDLVKKRMWKDGHMVDEQQQYLRSRKAKDKKIMAIYSTFYQIRGANDDFNNNGVVELQIENLFQEKI